VVLFKSLKSKNIDGLYKRVIIALFGFYIGWILTAHFDAPQDGHWLIGLLPALMINLANFKREKQNCNNSSF
jgi:hypothetical protein